MLKFDKLAWRGCGVCAVRQFHFGQELSPRGLFPRVSAVFLAEADGLGAQSFGCLHSQGQKLLFLPLANHVSPVFFWWKVGL